MSLGVLAVLAILAIFFAVMGWLYQRAPITDEVDKRAILNARRVGYTDEQIAAMSGWALPQVHKIA